MATTYLNTIQIVVISSNMLLIVPEKMCDAESSLRHLFTLSVIEHKCSIPRVSRNVIKKHGNTPALTKRSLLTAEKLSKVYNLAYKQHYKCNTRVLNCPHSVLMMLHTSTTAIISRCNKYRNNCSANDVICCWGSVLRKHSRFFLDKSN